MIIILLDLAVEVNVDPSSVLPFEAIWKSRWIGWANIKNTFVLKYEITQWISYENRRRSAFQRFRKWVWWLFCGLIHHSVVNPGKLITVEKYYQKIDKMYQKLLQHQPALVRNNAPQHVTQLILQNLNKLGYEILPYLPYLPDLSSTDS